MMRPSKGITLLELMVTVAIIAVIVTLAAPSFSEFILMQRLKSVSSQVVTDMQYARAEAAARNTPTYVYLGNNLTNTCYSIYVKGPTGAGVCVCGLDACYGDATELRRFSVDRDRRVSLAPATFDLDGAVVDHFSYDPPTGAMVIPQSDFNIAPGTPFTVDARVDTPRALRTVISPSGRPSNCTPPNSTMTAPACPPMP